MKKINSSLQCKTKSNKQNMLRKNLHIESKNCFSPAADYTVSGACFADA